MRSTTLARGLSLATAILLVAAIFAAAVTAKRQTSPTDLIATADAYSTKAAELYERAGDLATATAVSAQNFPGRPINVLGPTGEPLRQATTDEEIDLVADRDAEWSDCDRAAADSGNLDDRFVFVGVCEGALVFHTGIGFCTINDSVKGSTAVEIARWLPILPDGRTTYTEEEIDQAVEQFADYYGFGSSAQAYQERLDAEWAAGDVPEGVPLMAPRLKDVLLWFGCEIPQTKIESYP